MFSNLNYNLNSNTILNQKNTLKKKVSSYNFDKNINFSNLSNYSMLNQMTENIYKELTNKLNKINISPSVFKNHTSNNSVSNTEKGSKHSAQRNLQRPLSSNFRQK